MRRASLQTSVRRRALKLHRPVGLPRSAVVHRERLLPGRRRAAAPVEAHEDREAVERVGPVERARVALEAAYDRGFQDEVSRRCGPVDRPLARRRVVEPQRGCENVAARCAHAEVVHVRQAADDLAARHPSALLIPIVAAAQDGAQTAVADVPVAYEEIESSGAPCTRGMPGSDAAADTSSRVMAKA